MSSVMKNQKMVGSSSSKNDLGQLTGLEHLDKHLHLGMLQELNYLMERAHNLITYSRGRLVWTSRGVFSVGVKWVSMPKFTKQI